MQVTKNQKGMTLIEIVVVLLISTIIMVLAGSMILSTMGYFSDEVVDDQDKEGLDDIVNYVRSELSYTTDVRVASSKPSDASWNWFSIENGRLYQNGKALLADEYYQNRKITLAIQGFDKYRLDLYFQYLDIHDTQVYHTRTSLELLNLKATSKQDATFAPFDNITNRTTINHENKIYYIKDPKQITIPDTDGDGTVAEQIKCLNNATYRGDFVLNMYYYTGDIAFYDGTWWMCTHKPDFYGSYPNGVDPTTATSTGRRWKKLDKYFDEDSSYEVGDVVIYQGDNKRYEAQKDMLSWTPTPDSWNGSEGGYWKEVSDEYKENTTCKSLVSEQMIKTVRNKLDGIELDTIDEYSHSRSYQLDAVVYIIQANTGNKEYYVKVFEGIGEPGSGASSGWQHATRDYDANSAYVAGDVVAYLQNGIEYIEFLKTIDIEINIEAEIHQTDPAPSQYVKRYVKE